MPVIFLGLQLTHQLLFKHTDTDDVTESNLWAMFGVCRLENRTFHEQSEMRRNFYVLADADLKAWMC